MSERRQPFTEHLSRSKRSAPKMGWLAACALGVLAVLFFSLWASLRANQPDLDALRSQLQTAEDRLSTAQAANQTNLDQITALRAQVTELQQEKEAASHLAKGLEDEMRSDLESKDVTLSKLQGKLTVTILDRILFDSGEAVLKSDGEAVLKKIALILTKHPDLKIHVIGHTDNVPIRAAAQGRFASNWELSTARALAAVHFLTEHANLDPRRVGAVGYGEYQPIADNSTSDGRAMNRRIAITILPEELAGADSAPSAKLIRSTDLQPAASEPETPTAPQND